MATYTDTANVEAVETVPGHACTTCRKPLTDFVVRGNNSKVVISRVRLYTYNARTGALTCTDCTARPHWTKRQAMR